VTQFADAATTRDEIAAHGVFHEDILKRPIFVIGQQVG